MEWKYFKTLESVDKKNCWDIFVLAVMQLEYALLQNIITVLS